MVSLLRAKCGTWSLPLRGARTLLASPLSSTRLPSGFGSYCSMSHAKGLSSQDLLSGCFPAAEESEAQ